jgi:hypothetical protein
MNPTELIPSYYNFLAKPMEFILNEYNRASQTNFFEVVRSNEDGGLFNVANIYNVIELEIKDGSLSNYRLLIMLVPQASFMHLVFKNVDAVIQLPFNITIHMILNRIELIINDDQGGVCEISK